MSTPKLPLDELGPADKSYFCRASVAASLIMVALFCAVLIAVWHFWGVPESVVTAVHPRKLTSIPSILLSNFFHFDSEHLLSNLIMFVPLGFLVFKFEGLSRGGEGIFIGMLIAGAATWIFGDGATLSAGFSGAVMACWGILLVSAIRRDYRLVVVFLFLSYVFLEYSLFDTIRPTATAKSNNIAWLGHLGGMVGGMAAQIRSLPVALELLYRCGKITQPEFIAIASRLEKNTAGGNSYAHYVDENVDKQVDKHGADEADAAWSTDESEHPNTPQR